jgi:hypothetical protein
MRIAGKKKVLLTKSTKYDMQPRCFWLGVIIVEGGDGRINKNNLLTTEY